MTKAIILLSGGLDSVVSYACLKNEYDEFFALTFDYSQKSIMEEIQAAKAISDFYGIKQKVISLKWLGEISGTHNIPVLSEDELNNIEITKNSAKAVWIPNRNALFLNIAASFAEASGFNDIIFGANKEESITFIDNSKKFVYTVNEMLKYSVNSKISVKAPLIDMTKDEIVKKGMELNIPFSLIYSCYNGTKKHCGVCESCLRLKRALKKCGRNDIINTIFG